MEELVDDAKAKGVSVLTGGETTAEKGWFYPATVLAEVSPEAVALAGGTEYGLSLGILTRDIARAMELADRIPSGAVHINDQTVNDEATAPFGGVGASGNGSRHGGAAANLEAFTEQQWVTVRGAPPVYPF